MSSPWTTLHSSIPADGLLLMPQNPGKKSPPSFAKPSLELDPLYASAYCIMLGLLLESQGTISFYPQVYLPNRL